MNSWIKLTQKGCFQSTKEKKGNEHQMLHVQINADAKFQF